MKRSVPTSSLQLFTILAAVITMPTPAVGQTVDVTRVNDEVVIPAGTEWNSPVRLGEVCGFDLSIKYDEVFETTTFEAYEVWHITISDEYRNLSTGFRFLDTADYFIRHDLASGIAFHAGTFWIVYARQRHQDHGDDDRLLSDGKGGEKRDAGPRTRLSQVVRDIGTFLQDWTGAYPWPVMDPTGPHHDVNSVPFGTRSYCGWAEGNFP